ncbi:hypothetical protein SERLA73DRAFT_177169 [Serpula lacrymans var. lacrymans S7.3]|uniref:Fork-head domain-containing protein n=1 Tax=Serpula lacrymans var. lacrymans (strain S7.3) TaxID=936435 RepID=F8PNI9_SERL3|nr:hypothetical protein SERLA73DRAFT_177169 [Serpula lacrymans var. lacrymans S7.3]
MMSQQPPPTVMPANMMPPPDQPDLSQANSYYPQEPNDLTGGLPINLDSLRDGPPGSKPFYPYSTLIRYAIKGSPNQKLLLEDIYYAIESRFPYFRSAPSGWKNSVRHNLSLNPCFEKVPRPLTDRGKGSYWTVNDNVDPRTGVHRGQKQGRNSEEQDVDYHPPEPAFSDPHQFVQPPMHPDDAGPSRQAPYPPPYPPPFDPAFSMMPPGMRFPPPPAISLGPDQFEVDEHGNINWRMSWMKELGHLQQITAEQEKAGVDEEWYRMMLIRVRSALMTPYAPDGMHVAGGPPSAMPPHVPPNGELQQ